MTRGLTAKSHISAPYIPQSVSHPRPSHTQPHADDGEPTANSYTPTLENHPSTGIQTYSDDSDDGDSATRSSTPTMKGDEVELNRRCLVQWVQKCITLQWRAGTIFTEEIVRAIWSGTYRAEETFYPAELCPLHVCASENVQYCAQLLLKYGWPVNERCDVTGETALHTACDVNNFRMARLLLDNGADPNAVDFFSQTPLIVAILRDAHKCVHVLTSKHAAVVTAMTGNAVSPGEENNAMVWAAKKNVYAIREMIANYSFDELSFGNNKALMEALSFSNYETSRVLLNYATEQNCSQLVNLADAYGKTPLMVIGWTYCMRIYRDEKSHVECLNLLLECGADANAPCGAIHCPALYHAIKSEYSDEYCLILLEHTDLYAMETEQLDEIVYATAFRGKTAVMKSLCEKRDDLICTKGFDLIVRAFLGSFIEVEMVDILLEAGVDVARDDRKKSRCYTEYFPNFIDYAPDVMLKILEMLLRAGAAAENVNLLLSLESQYKPEYLSEEEELLAKKDTELFLVDAAEVLWKYGTQSHWNKVVRDTVGFNRVEPRLPSLRHCCRSALRRALMLTGQYPSMRKVDTRQLGLPESLQKYLTFPEATSCEIKVTN